jgi:hypothetical protein
MSSSLIPASFTEARPALEPRLVGATASAITYLELQNAGAESGFGATMSVTPDLGIGAVVITPAGGVQVSASTLASWNVTIEDVVKAAVERTYGRKQSASKYGAATFVSTDESFAAAVLFNPSMVSGFAVQGKPVIIVPSTGTLVVTGSDDEQGLIAAASLADAAVIGGQKLVSASALVRDGAAWREFTWPDTTAVKAAADLLARRWSSTLYTWQAPALSAMLTATANDMFVAEAAVLKSPSGDVVTSSTLTEGVTTALPVTDIVVLVSRDGSVSQAPWPRFIEVMGDQAQPWAVSPPRIVAPFPSAEQLAQL